MKYDVFISYSRKDYIDEKKKIIPNNIISKIKEMFEANNIRYWFDEDGIYSGDAFAAVIARNIRASEIFLFISSENSNASEWTSNEIATANFYQKKIIPFRYDDSVYNESIIMYLASLDYIDYKTDPNSSFSRLLSSVKTHLKEDVETQVYKVKGVEFKMIKVEGGTFSMGTNDSCSDEKPVHQVTLSDYYMAETPVTQELWKAVMEVNPSEFQNDSFPVENVSWESCQEFIIKIREITGVIFKLPTEAEWEYAARGGKYSKNSIYAGSNDIDQVAWWVGNSGSTTHSVKTKKPNELGIYDMSGNVWEWCYDNYGSYCDLDVKDPVGPQKGTSKVQRGGCWDTNWGDGSKSCRVTYRSQDLKTHSSQRIGFRLAIGTYSLPDILKFKIIDREFYMLLSEDKTYYIGNVLDKGAEFKWLKTKSIKISDMIITGTAVATTVILPGLAIMGAILYAIFSSGSSNKNEKDLIVDEKFCSTISNEYKFSVPNDQELGNVNENEKKHCVVLRINENSKLTEFYKRQ